MAHFAPYGGYIVDERANLFHFDVFDEVDSGGRGGSKATSLN